jgi:hypothetical protein
MLKPSLSPHTNLWENNFEASQLRQHHHDNRESTLDKMKFLKVGRVASKYFGEQFLLFCSTLLSSTPMLTPIFSQSLPEADMPGRR